MQHSAANLTNTVLAHLIEIHFIWEMFFISQMNRISLRGNNLKKTSVYPQIEKLLRNKLIRLL